MRPKKPITPESALKSAVKELLAIYRIWTFPITAGMGSHPGIADRLGIFKGKPLAIEIKRPKGRLTANQIAFKEKWEAEGGIYIAVWALDDLIRSLGIKTLGTF